MGAYILRRLLLMIPTLFGIMLISSDLPEVLAMSDRILVMREGRQMGIFNHDEATQETVMTAAMGQSWQTVEQAAV